MDHIGVNVYFWGDAEPRRLLVDGLRPWALEAFQEGLARRFWYCPFDARGPHVFAIFALGETGEEERARLREFLAARVDAFLRESPSLAAPDPGELEQRHAECRGKFMCNADREEGLAPNNSFILFDQEPDGYPWSMSSGIAAADDLCQLLSDLSFWCLSQLERGSQTPAAIRWLAAVDRALARHGQSAADSWELHATTLVLPLAERLKSQRDEVLSSLPAAVSERNRQVFSRLWQDAGSDSLMEAHADRLVEIVTAERRFRTLRDVNHGILGQLGQPVMFHIPLVLYAWQRNLPPSPI